MENNFLNGRVDVLSRTQSSFNYVKSNNRSNNGYDLVSRNIEHTPVSSLFFSKQNIDALQQGICNMVYNMSQGKYKVGKQSESDLKIIMRSIYFNSLNQGYNNAWMSIKGAELQNTSCDKVLDEVRKLNKNVLDWSVPQIITNIEQFDKYKKDISMLPIPLERPALLSVAGSKTLELQPFL